MTDDIVSGPAADDAVVRAFDFSLTEAGFVRAALNWVWESDTAFVAFTAVRDGAAYSLRVGWRFDEFDDPPAEPRTAHGCVRSMTLDEIGALVGKPMGVVGEFTEEAVADFEQRLATVVRKHVLRWVEAWKRPDGFRDFLADKELHLAAGWASALLGHTERSRLELGYAMHLFGLPLDETFDRRRADADEAIAAVFAASHGLAAELGAADEGLLDAFTSERGRTARDKVLEPHTEHRRMQARHEAYARVCLTHLGYSEAV